MIKIKLVQDVAAPTAWPARGQIAHRSIRAGAIGQLVTLAPQVVRQPRHNPLVQSGPQAPHLEVGRRAKSFGGSRRTDRCV